MLMLTKEDLNNSKEGRPFTQVVEKKKTKIEAHS